MGQGSQTFTKKFNAFITNSITCYKEMFVKVTWSWHAKWTSGCLQKLVCLLLFFIYIVRLSVSSAVTKKWILFKEKKLLKHKIHLNLFSCQLTHIYYSNIFVHVPIGQNENGEVFKLCCWFHRALTISLNSTTINIWKKNKK